MFDDKKKINFYIGIATAVVGILTYATSAYFDYQHRQYLALEHKIEVNNTNITALISRQEDAYQAVVGAITQIRQVRTNIMLTCKRFPDKINDKQFLLDSDIAIYASGYNLISAQGLADFVFSEEMHDKIHEFNIWEISTTAEDICSNKEAKDSEYESKQLSIEQDIQKVIKETKARIR